MMTICLKAALKNKLIHIKSFVNYDLVKTLERNPPIMKTKYPH